VEVWVEDMFFSCFALPLVKNLIFKINLSFKKHFLARHQWLMPVILTTQEAEIRSIKVRSQPGQTVPRDPILKNPSQK
jgi:hypothetical protein